MRLLSTGKTARQRTKHQKMSSLDETLGVFFKIGHHRRNRFPKSEPVGWTENHVIARAPRLPAMAPDKPFDETDAQQRVGLRLRDDALSGDNLLSVSAGCQQARAVFSRHSAGSRYPSRSTSHRPRYKATRGNAIR